MSTWTFGDSAMISRRDDRQIQYRALDLLSESGASMEDAMQEVGARVAIVCVPREDGADVSERVAMGARIPIQELPPEDSSCLRVSQELELEGNRLIVIARVDGDSDLQEWVRACRGLPDVLWLGPPRLKELLSGVEA